MSESLIAANNWSILLPGRLYGYEKRRVRLSAKGELVKRGDQLPYYSITGDVQIMDRRYRDPFILGGCIHDEILKYWPELAPLVRVHLSGPDGVPMHAEANARYWAGLANYQPDDNYGRRVLETDNQGRQWAPDTLADHLRVSVREAREAREAMARGISWRQILETLNLIERWSNEAGAARKLLRDVQREAN